MTDLSVELFLPEDEHRVDGLPPVLLVHGLASSAELNWNRTGWIPALTRAGRTVIAVDLPGHGASAPPEADEDYRPRRIGELVLSAADGAYRGPNGHDGDAATYDVIGYSLGSRLAWELAASQPERFRRMVLGAPSHDDPLAAFDVPAAERFLASGVEVEDPKTAEFLRMGEFGAPASLSELVRMIREIQVEPFMPAAAIPRAPALLVAGENDDLAGTMPDLAALLPTAELLWLPGRNHLNAVSGRAFKQGAIDFLAETTAP